MKTFVLSLVSLVSTVVFAQNPRPKHLICFGGANFGAELRASNGNHYEGEIGQASESSNAHYDDILFEEPKPGILIFKVGAAVSGHFPEYEITVDSNNQYHGFVEITYSSSGHAHLNVYGCNIINP